MKKGQATIIAAILAFWALFYALYPYRKLMDDGTYGDILTNKYFRYHPGQTFSRLLHDGLMYLQGYLLEPSPEKAVFLSILLHLLTGWIAWKFVVPRMPEDARRTAALGLAAFLVHPVALQTTVHISQRGEILGTLFLVLSLAVYLRGGLSLQPAWLALTGLGALLSKESFAVVPFVLLAATVLKHRSRGGLYAMGAMSALLLAGVYFHTFSHGVIQNEGNYRRSEAFHDAVLMGESISNENSIFYPLRSPSENLRLQTALVPLISKIVFFPIALVKDYGHFPYGPGTYRWSLPWFWIGAGLLLAIAAILIRWRKSIPIEEWPLVLSPALHQAVYWIVIVYDPLLLYRMYGLSFLTLTIAFPVLWRRVSLPARLKNRFPMALAAIIALGGSVRAWEMRNPVTETGLELKRGRYNYRHYNFHMQERIRAGVPTECDALMRPALPLAPSSSLVHMEWAWCLRANGHETEARTHALKALEQETVPGYVDLALSYLVGAEGIKVDLDRVHPYNRQFLAPERETP